MPELKIHCKISKERTGKEFADLHEWMDDGYKYLGRDHRFERHSGAYIEYVKETWGKEGVCEFLNHIIEDFKGTLAKYEGKCVVCGKDTWKGKKLCIVCYKKLNPEKVGGVE